MKRRDFLKILGITPVVATAGKAPEVLQTPNRRDLIVTPKQPIAWEETRDHRGLTCYKLIYPKKNV